jgi:hypothetical protein
MKFWSRVVRILLATVVATQGAAFIPALAASQSKRLAVKAIGIEELKSEYGAGNVGGGGGTPVVADPDTNGGGSCTIYDGACSLVMFSSDITNLVQTQTANGAYSGSQLYNDSAVFSALKSATFSDGCRLTISSAVGISIPAGIGVGIERTCGDVQTVSRTLPRLGRANIYYNEWTSTYTEHLMFNWVRYGNAAGYAGMRTENKRKVERQYFVGPTL